MGYAPHEFRGFGIPLPQRVSRTEEGLEVLRRCFDFIALDELPRRLGRPARRPFCLLTFDDGKCSHATEVAPDVLMPAMALSSEA